MTSPAIDPAAVHCVVSGCTHIAAGTVIDVDEPKALPVCASHFAQRSALLAS